MYRLNPHLRAQGKNPFIWDVPDTEHVAFKDYLQEEIRYKTLSLTNPEEAERLTKLAISDNEQRFKDLKHLSEQ